MTTPARKAIWYVESHYAAPLTLEDVAANCGVSPYHLTRAFASLTGWPVMRYARNRRLTEAARALAGGAPDILAVALDAGYASHEAFTRAFHDQLGLTPEAVRAQGHVDNIALTEPFNMRYATTKALEEPRIETTSRPLLIAGINQRYSCETAMGMPAQWQRFQPFIGNIAGQVGAAAYGVVHNGDDNGNVDYLCGVEVGSFSDLPQELSPLRIAPARYAVFAHRDHVAAIRSTFTAIWDTWLPQSGHKAADAPFFERYDATFNPDTGLGGIEIWIPIEG
ncbi:AraC family transcriptional regulator [Vineibacter terrae]|uniref:AraC family transcriptional regulator n=1 Tax=Vineibacter terrae TaxID=2586908 RepID=UPI002E37D75D|nr:AraC family transcriptional regulator [Vineibacter terrae]HEX2886051.1 AraC family transcriptional regulator [Vineibacter terrae]